MTWQPGQWIQDAVARIGLHRLAMWIFRQRIVWHMRWIRLVHREEPIIRVDEVNEQTGESRRVLGRGEL